MDLIALSRKAVRKPLHHTNFFVLFVTIFLILITGLSIVSAVNIIAAPKTVTNKCDADHSKRFSGKVSANNQSVYQLHHNGSGECLLTASFVWKNSDDISSIWVYKPDGEIEIIKPSAEQTTAVFAKNSPLEVGKWRFVVKSDQAFEHSYSGEVSVK